MAASAPTAPRIPERELAIWRAFLAAHARVIREIEARLRDVGLPSLSWYDVLWPLYAAPDRRLRMRELADQVVLSRTGLVRLIDRIERAGLLRREPVPSDGRGAYAVLTDEGEHALRQVWPTYARVIRTFLEELGDDRETVRGALERIAAGQPDD